MPELSLTRDEIRELVGLIAAQLAREITGEPFRAAEGTKEAPCGCEVSHAHSEVTDPAEIQPSPDVKRLAQLLDHTLLRPEATAAELIHLCDEARQFGFGAVCVNPAWTALAAERLQGSEVKVTTVVGFPFGASLARTKRAEAEAALIAGARELDMVIDVGALRSGEPERVRSDIRGVVETAHAAGAAVKVILENAYLTDEQKVEACRIAQTEGADYVKTSTGFGPSGATEADVRLMRETVGPEMGVKAAGGIRTLADAMHMLAAGATRLGTSASVSILAEASRVS